MHLTQKMGWDDYDRKGRGQQQLDLVGLNLKRSKIHTLRRLASFLAFSLEV